MNKQYDTLHKLLDAYYSAAVEHQACGGDFGTSEKLSQAEQAIEEFCEAVANGALPCWMRTDDMPQFQKGNN